MSQAVASAPPPSPAVPRALAPDLARGMMLLLIAVANVSWYLWGHEGGAYLVHPTDGGPGDRVIAALLVVFVDGRIYPMFAFLFGYGMVQFCRSRTAAGLGETDIRRQLRRRHWWLIAFGLLHAALLFAGDILGLYGLLGLLIGWLLVFRRTETIQYWLIALGGLAMSTMVVGVYAMGGLSLLEAVADPAETGGMQAQAFGVDWVRDSMSGIEPYGLAMLLRVAIWLVILLGQLFTFFVPFCILAGVLAARHGLLDRPAEHTRTLRLLAGYGIAIAWLTGIPAALAYLGVIPGGDATLSMLSLLAQGGGLAGGIGYAAAFGLLARRMGQARGILSRAVTGIGKRSLSFYLLQSVLLAPLLSAWAFGLGGRLGTAAAVSIAIGVWLISLPLAFLLESRGVRGPAELVLRRLTYGRRQPARSEEHTPQSSFPGSAQPPRR